MWYDFSMRCLHYTDGQALTKALAAMASCDTALTSAISEWRAVSASTGSDPNKPNRAICYGVKHFDRGCLAIYIPTTV